MKYLVLSTLATASAKMLVGGSFKDGYMCKDLIDEWVYQKEDKGIDLYQGTGDWNELKTECRAAVLNLR